MCRSSVSFLEVFVINKDDNSILLIIMSSNVSTRMLLQVVPKCSSKTILNSSWLFVRIDL